MTELINNEDFIHLNNILRHIENVKQNCELIAEKLIRNSEFDLGKDLIQNSLIHDNSKLSGIEFLYLREDTKTDKPELFIAALHQHNSTNPHHPEFYVGGIKEMPRVAIAEMVSDWKARSEEFGSDLMEWINESATKKFQFSKQCKIYKDIKDFVKLLLDKKFN